MFMRSILEFGYPSRFPPSPVKGQDMMSCVVMRNHGPPSMLEYEESFPAPLPAKMTKQISIDIVAAGCNPVDFKLRKGPIPNVLFPKPKIIGADFAGIVRKIPHANSKFRIGQRVFGMLPVLSSPFGSYASQCCADESRIAAAPHNVELTDLASIPLVACTVIQALRPVIAAFGGKENCKDRKCFIQAGSGGLGTFAVQYCAKVLCMQVATTASPEHSDLLHSLGAYRVIDYKKEKWWAALEDYDVFFDSMGYKYEAIVLAPNSKILRKSGAFPSHYIHIAASPYGDQCNHCPKLTSDPLGLAIPESRLDRVLVGYAKQLYSQFLSTSNVKYHFIFVEPDAAALEETAAAMASGKIRAVIQQVLPLQDAWRAHELLEECHVTGKIVLRIRDPN